MARLVNGPVRLINKVIRDALIERCEQAEKGVWITASKEVVPLSKLELSHLANILNLYLNEKPPFHVPGLAERLVKPLLKEAKSRGYNEDNVGHDRFELIELE